MSLLWQAVDRHPEISDRTYNRFLRYPAARPLEGPLAENAAWAREWFRVNAHPWCCAVRADAAVHARAVALLPEADEYANIVASAGPEPDAEAAERWAAGEPDRYFFIESFASAIVEALVLETRARLSTDKHLSPGHRGWPLEENPILMNSIRAAGTLPGPLDMLPSGMLTPKKSQLAVCPLQLLPEPRSVSG
jgi:hypothetical protein